MVFRACAVQVGLNGFELFAHGISLHCLIMDIGEIAFVLAY